jgi:hypothetical protein
MGNFIYLNVRTVPAFDTDLMQPHTAYTVFCDRGEKFLIASAWTLKDAVQLFRKKYGFHEDFVIRFNRPFTAQRSI